MKEIIDELNNKIIEDDIQIEVTEYCKKDKNEFDSFTIYLKKLDSKNNYNYRLMEVSPANNDGKLPLKVKCFYINITDIYYCIDLEIFKKRIEKYLKSKKTKTIIDKIKSFG